MNKTKKTVLAIFFIVSGIALIWWQIYLPIVAAMNHKPEINYEYKALVFGPAMLLFGLYMLFAPKDIDFGRGYTPGDKKHNRFVIITVLLFVLIAVVTFVSFQEVIRSYGYR